MCFPMGACLHHTCGPDARAPRCVQGGITHLLVGAVVLGGPEARALRCMRGGITHLLIGAVVLGGPEARALR